MMKKNLKLVFIIILIFVLLIPITYSYALSIVELGKNEKQFFEISKTEFTKNEKVEMTINLDSIKYDEFIFELKSDEVIENVEIAQSEQIEAEKNNNEIVMEINKEKTNVKTINLFYSIPENKNVGDTIKFIASITSIIKNEVEETDKEQNNQPIEKEEIKQPTETEEIKKEESEISTENKEANIMIDGEEKEENKPEINEIKPETQSIEFEIKIIEEENDNKPENNKPENQIPNTENNKQEMDNNKIPNQNNAPSTTVQKIPTNNSNIQYNSMSNISIGGSQVAKVTYKGSDNNYLSELSVEGYTLNREFSKENTTYFITVGNEVEEVEIATNVIHDEATVTIYGNKELKEGTNKILIAVTAENGNVRNYRIYVTKNS